MGKEREIKKRIKSVNNISQVTNAMQLVAASRMRKAQDNAEKGKSYNERIKKLMIELSLDESLTSDPFLNPHYSNSHKILLVVFSPQRGLAGALPGNLSRFVHQFVEEQKSRGHQIELVLIGQKLRNQLVQLSVDFVADFSDMPEQPTTADIRPLMKLITSKYLDKDIGKVFMIYPEFVNALKQVPTLKLLLPLDLEGLHLSQEDNVYNVKAQSTIGFTFEPEQEAVFEALVPAYLESQIYQTRLETIASEYSARMVSMKNATDNAKELKSNLTILFNKSRQAQITQELAEINAARI